MAVKRLINDKDMELWKASQTFQDLIGFITTLATSVEGRENGDYVQPISDNVQKLIKLLDSVIDIIGKHEVIKDANTSRFGKIEFRDFYDELAENVSDMVVKTLELGSDTVNSEQLSDLCTYLTESWGDRTRIDYGSGHELNFICFLYCLFELKVLELDKDSTNAVLVIFIKYLDIMRKLETKYWLEPAGSHGVWGLDDYHFLPFLFGAFQLSTHKHLKPKSIHNPEVVEMFQDRYLYFGCIAFINKVKTTASLRWHSPMLDDISGVKKWSKVAEGMVKMYKVEVLSKLPIMQHFYFGVFLPCPDGVTEYSTERQHEIEESSCCSDGSSHPHSTWADCCGIAVPSAIAASEMSHRQHEKRIPFD